MRLTGCETCGLRDLCDQSEKNLGICGDYFEIHEIDDWETEDENEWASLLWFQFLNKEILEDDLIAIDSW